jgi:hypothetical protein
VSLFESGEVKHLRQQNDKLLQMVQDLTTKVALLADPAIIAREAAAERAKAATQMAVEREKRAEPDRVLPMKGRTPGAIRATGADRPDPRQDITPRPSA